MSPLRIKPSLDLNRPDLRMTEEEIDIQIFNALIDVGINLDDAIETQRDLQYLRRLREISQKIKEKAIMTITAAVVTALVGYLVLGFQSSIPQKQPELTQEQLGAAIVELAKQRWKNQN